MDAGAVDRDRSSAANPVNSLLFLLRRQELAVWSSPPWGKSERNIPQTCSRGTRGCPQGGATKTWGKKKPRPWGGRCSGWEMPPAAVPMAMLQGGMLVATGDGAAVGRAELEEPGALGKRWGFT